jgi:hypothetical protein
MHFWNLHHLVEIGGDKFKARQQRDPISKTNKGQVQNRAGRVAQVAENLPSKCKALSSKPSTTKKR